MKNILLFAAIALSAHVSFGQILIPVVPSTPGRGGFSLLLQGLRTGTRVHLDEQFDSTFNGIVVYNGTGNGNVSIQRVAASGLPNTSGYCLEITHTGPAQPFLGGFYQKIQSGPNKTFVHLFRAKIPNGYAANISSNVLGTGFATKWLTPQGGTGKWEDYGVVIACGNAAPFGTGGYVFLTGDTPSVASPVVWQVASSAAYDLTDLKYHFTQILQGLHQTSDVAIRENITQILQELHPTADIAIRENSYGADNTDSNAALSDTPEALAKKTEELTAYILQLANETALSGGEK